LRFAGGLLGTADWSFLARAGLPNEPVFITIYEGNPNEGPTPVEVCVTVAADGLNRNSANRKLIATVGEVFQTLNTWLLGVDATPPTSAGEGAQRLSESTTLTVAGVITRINEFQSTIAAAVQEQTATTQAINHGVTLAAQGSAQIADTIGAVARTAASTAESMALGNVSAHELREMRTELDTLIATFRLPRQPASHHQVCARAMADPQRSHGRFSCDFFMTALDALVVANSRGGPSGPGGG
jgi:hypothetical protein